MATRNEMKIILTAVNRASKELKAIKKQIADIEKATKKAQQQSAKTKKSMQKNWAQIAIAIGGAVIALRKIFDETKKIFEATAQLERWQVQMRTFTESTQEAHEALQEMIEFSVRTPFTPQAVIQAGKLLKPLEELGFKMEDLLTASGNAAAAFGLRFDEAALQMVRSFTAGIGAADLFRDRGVRSFIEITEGVDLTTLSLEELRKELIESLTTGGIGAAIERESRTLAGRVSTLQGNIFLLRTTIGEKLLPVFKEFVEEMIKLTEATTSFVNSDFVGSIENLHRILTQEPIKGSIFSPEFKKFLSERITGFKILTDLMLLLNQEGQNTSVEGGEQAQDALNRAKELAQKTQEENKYWADRIQATVDNNDLIQSIETQYGDWKKKLTIQDKLDFVSMEQEKINMVLERANIDKKTEESLLKHKQKLGIAERNLNVENFKSYVETAMAMGKSTASIMGELATMTGETWLKGAEIVINTVVSVMKVIIAAIDTTLGPLGWLKVALDVTAITLAAANAFAQIESQRSALSSIPKMAEGGTTITSGVAMVGERGPELLMLPRGAQVQPLGGGGVAQTVHIEINYPTIRSDEDIDELTEEISRRLAFEAERI